MRVAYIQTDPGMLQAEANTREAVARIQRLSADLIVLPELFNTGYNFSSKKEAARLAESLDEGASLAALQDAARRKDCAIVAGFAEKRGGKLYNSAAFITPRKREVYRKTHLYGREKLIFSPGDTGFRVFAWKGARVGVMVCFDWFFPESCRTLALKGAQVIAHPANLVLPYCPDAMRTRSLENRVYSITCDRVGKERGLRFIGTSQIVDPWGKVLACASSTREESATARIDPAQASNKKLNRFNDLLHDRRTKAYY